MKERIIVLFFILYLLGLSIFVYYEFSRYSKAINIDMKNISINRNLINDKLDYAACDNCGGLFLEGSLKENSAIINDEIYPDRVERFMDIIHNKDTITVPYDSKHYYGSKTNIKLYIKYGYYDDNEEIQWLETCLYSQGIITKQYCKKCYKIRR